MTDAILERIRPLIDQSSDLKRLLLALHRPDCAFGRPVAAAGRSPATHWPSFSTPRASTGTPSLARPSHSNLLHNSALIAYAFEHTRSASGVFWSPSYHDMGLVGGILQPLYAGLSEHPDVAHGLSSKAGPLAAGDIPLRRDNERRPEFRLRPVRRRKITPMKPATLDLSSWTVAFTGAEPVRAEAPRAVRRPVRTVRFPAGGLVFTPRLGRGDAARVRRVQDSRNPSSAGSTASRWRPTASCRWPPASAGPVPWSAAERPCPTSRLSLPTRTG